MTCKVRRDFEIITDLSSCVSLVTSNVRGYSIRSPKSLYKKTGPDPSYPSLLRPIYCDKRVSNSHLSHTHRRHREEWRGRNFSSWSDHSWIKTTAIFFLYLRVCVYLFLRTSFFTAQNVGPMVHLKQSTKSFNQWDDVIERRH